MTSLHEGLLLALGLIAGLDAQLAAIVLRSLAVSGLACLFACGLGLLLGAWLGVSRFAPYEGFVSGPDASHSLDSFGRTRVLRGCSRVSAARLKSPRFRHFAAPERDDLFCGFRSCAV